MNPSYVLCSGWHFESKVDTSAGHHAFVVRVMHFDKNLWPAGGLRRSFDVCVLDSVISAGSDRFLGLLHIALTLSGPYGLGFWSTVDICMHSTHHCARPICGQIGLAIGPRSCLQWISANMCSTYAVLR